MTHADNKGTEPTPMADPGGELRLDLHRRSRTGLGEAVYAPGKSPEQCMAAVKGLLAGANSEPVLLTRADQSQIKVVGHELPGPKVTRTGDKLTTMTWRPLGPRFGDLPVLTAGTGDLPVALEAVAVLKASGVSASLVADASVAGLHRAFTQREALMAADVVVVVAGLTSAPVLDVPTSTGYGSGFEVVTALLGMLASSPGISVFGIDNGFGAACSAVRILGLLENRRNHA